MGPIDDVDDRERARIRSKVLWRLSPFLGLMYLVNWLDRTNIAFAGPSGMTEDLGMTATAFGFAGAIFFVGYLLLEIPSNLALHRFGARRWLARILVSWGIVASVIAFVPNASTLYVLRLLLGIAEAGFAPGVLFYLTYWFTKCDRARAMALFLVAIPLTSVIGSPIASALIEYGSGVFGLVGWRFMILMTGLPAILLGVVCWFYLTDRPEQASWLTGRERQILAADLKRDEVSVEKTHNIREGLTNPSVWLLGLVYFGVLYGLYSIGFFLPTIITGFEAQFNVDYSTMQVGLLTMIPYGFAAIAMVTWARISDRRGEVAWHLAIPAVAAGIGLVASTYAPNPWLAMIGITIGAMGILSAMPILWAMPSLILTGAAAAGGMALVNSVGNLGGFAGPYLTGWLSDLTGAGNAGMWMVLLFLVVSAGLSVGIFAKRFTQQPAQTPTPAPSEPAWER